MPTVTRVTETLYNHVTGELEFVSPLTVAMANNLSLKTVLMIKGSATYEDYEAQRNAQHPKSAKPPLAERLTKIEQQLSEVLQLLREPRLL